MTRPSGRSRTLAVRADANARVGAGHVVRSVALADAWRRSGGDAMLFTVSPLPFARAAAERYGIAVHAFGSSDAAWAALAECARAQSDTWVVLDGYELGVDAQRSVRSAGARLLVIDDCRRGAEFDCDILVNQNIGADALGYRVAAETRCCFGPAYALLRREFSAQRPAHRFDEPASRIVVTFGGADVHDQAARVARLLAGATPPLEATIVAGQAHTPPKDVSVRDGVQIRWQPAADDIARLLAGADLAICAAGSTCWELAHLGVPALTLVVADNQNVVAAGLDRAGVIRNLGWYADVSDAGLASAIERLRGDDARGEMSRRGRALVDGRGADRVVEAMRVAAVEA